MMKIFRLKNQFSDLKEIDERNQKLIKSYLSGLNYAQVGKKFSLSRERVRVILNKNRVQKHETSKQRILKNLSKIKKQLIKGKTKKQIASQLNINEVTFNNALSELGFDVEGLKQIFYKSVKCKICGQLASNIKRKLCRKHYRAFQYKRRKAKGYYREYYRIYRKKKKSDSQPA